MKVIFRYLLTFFSVVILGYILLVAAYALPVGRMQANAIDSKAALGSGINLVSPDSTSDIDIYTDTLMLLTAANESDDSPVTASLLNYHFAFNGPDPALANQNVPVVSYKDDPVIAYQKILDGGWTPVYFPETDSSLDQIEYSRYWHGYLIFMKPLLLLFDYGQLRIINMLVQICLLMASVILLTQRKRLDLTVAVVGLWVFLNPLSELLCLQFSCISSLTLISFLALILLRKRYESNGYLLLGHFLVFGMLTSYFDLFTYPLVIMGTSTLFWVTYSDNISNARALKNPLVCGLACMILWCVGYAGMWASKWVLASLLTNSNVLQDAFANIQTRTSSNEGATHFGIIQVEKMNILAVSPLIYAFLACLFVYNAVRAAKAPVLPQRQPSTAKRQSSTAKHQLSTVILFVIIAVIPFMWYAAIRNHSGVHPFIAYREIGLTIFAVLLSPSLITPSLKKETAGGKPREVSHCQQSR